jgi:hypothetical protein
MKQNNADNGQRRYELEMDKLKNVHTEKMDLANKQHEENQDLYKQQQVEKMKKIDKGMDLKWKNIRWKWN